MLCNCSSTNHSDRKSKIMIMPSASGSGSAAPISSIKQEENCTHAFEIPTDDDDSHHLSPSKETAAAPAKVAFDEDNLLQLTDAQASKNTYPPGCPIWYNMQTTTKRLAACHGRVAAILIDLNSKSLVYKVTTGASSASSNSHTLPPPTEQEQIFLLEDQLAFALNCPVKVRGMVEGDPSKELEGKILCPRPGNKKRTFSYSVILTEGNQVKIELGVKPELIAYDKPLSVCVPIDTAKDDNAQHMKENDTDNLGSSKQMKIVTNNVESNVQFSSFNSNLNGGIAGVEDSKQIGRSTAKLDLQSSCSSSNLSTDFVAVHQKVSNQLAHDGANNGDNFTKDRPTINATSAGSQVPSNRIDPIPNNNASHSSNLTNEKVTPPFQRCNDREYLPTLQPAPVAKTTRTSNQKHGLAGKSNGDTGTACADSGQEISTVATSHQLDQTSCHRSRWTPPSLKVHPQPQAKMMDQDFLSQITVPLWVTDSSTRNLFFYLVGKRNGELGHKLVESITGCTLHIDQANPSIKTPMHIILKPKCQSGEFDLVKAREMVEDWLLEFLECDGAKAKLLYELALSPNAASNSGQCAESGIVQQRSHKTNRLVWMKLLDLPSSERGGLLSIEEDIKQRMQQEVDCSVEVFGRTMRLPVEICKPFALICGDCSSHVEQAMKLVRNVIENYHAPANSCDENAPMIERANKHDVQAVATETNRSLGSTNKFQSGDHNHFGQTSSQPNSAAMPKPSLRETFNSYKCASEGPNKNDKKAQTLPAVVQMLQSEKKLLEKPPSTISMAPTLRDDQKGSLSSERWAPPSTDVLQKPKTKRPPVKYRLTVPLWVTDSSRRCLFRHLIGDKACKSHRIESMTSYAVDITKSNKRNNTPMQLSFKPMFRRSHFDIEKARTMIEDSLLEFLECDGARKRLLYELAVTAVPLEGAPNLQSFEGGVVQQRDLKTNEIVWMKLLDLPTSNTVDLTALNKNVQNRIFNQTQSSVEVFGHGLNMKYPEICRPFALICGKNSEQVRTTTNLVIDAIEAHNFSPLSSGKRSQPCSRAKSLTSACDSAQLPSKASNGNKYEERTYSATLTLTSDRSQSVSEDHQGGRNSHEFPRKRKTISDSESLSGHSNTNDAMKRSRKSMDTAGDKQSYHGQNSETNTISTCIMAIPLWVMERCINDNDLYEHLAGERGCKLRKISSETGVSFKFLRYNSNKGKPLTIQIEHQTESRLVRKAKEMINVSLLEFLDDRASNAKLLYELALTSEESYNSHQINNCIVKLESHTTVWMKLLELPCVESKGKLTPHGEFLQFAYVQEELTDGNDCSIEVYGFEKHTPVLCNPYVLVAGKKKDQVVIVAKNISAKLLKHQGRCRCKVP